MARDQTTIEGTRNKKIISDCGRGALSAVKEVKSSGGTRCGCSLGVMCNTYWTLPS